MRILIFAASAYFGLVFGAGFALGIARTLILLPNFGERASELIEAPLMVVAILLASRFVVRQFRLSPNSRSRLIVGFGALVVLIAVEVTVVLHLRSLSIEEYISERDPIAGAVYVLLLIFYALAPWLLDRIPRLSN